MKHSIFAIVLMSLFGASAIASPAPGARVAERRIPISVTSKGFEPASISVKAGRPVVLVVTRKTDRTCAKEIVIADRKIRQALPLNRPVEVRLTPGKPGAIRFACGMDMVAGTLEVQ